MLYDFEVTRLNGDLYAFIRIQDEWTGNIKEGLRQIKLDGNQYYIRAETQRHNVTPQVTRFKMHEDKIKSALEWYDKTKF